MNNMYTKLKNKCLESKENTKKKKYILNMKKELVLMEMKCNTLKTSKINVEKSLKGNF